MLTNPNIAINTAQILLWFSGLIEMQYPLCKLFSIILMTLDALIQGFSKKAGNHKREQTIRDNMIFSF